MTEVEIAISIRRNLYALDWSSAYEKFQDHGDKTYWGLSIGLGFFTIGIYDNRWLITEAGFGD